MSQGKMEQVGTPSEIYNFPATEFVAKFVGQINLMPVEAHEPEEGIVKIGGQVVRTAKYEILDNKPLRLAVRPEELNPGHLDGANNLSGKVDSITYLGSIVRIRVDVEGHPFSLDVFNERKLNMPVVGEQFQVNFPVDACWIL
jgi:putative spermidine/putrescine transport system ATP-binding protein